MNLQSEKTGPPPPRTGVVEVQWRVVAIAAIVVALAAISVLAVVSTVKSADSLSVVALSLAILAFVVQIIIFVVQSAAASRQEVNATDIYGRTVQALSAIDEKSEGTRRTVATISDRLLDAAIGKAIPEARATGSGESSQEFSDDVSKRVRELIHASAETPKPRRRRPEIPHRTPDASMSRLPSGNAAMEAQKALSNLDGISLSIVSNLGEDQARNGGAQSDSTIGPGLRVINPYAAPELHKLGLISRRRVPWSPVPVFQLTELGKDAARLLNAPAEDDQLSPAAIATRQKLAADRERSRERASPEAMFKGIPVEED